MEPYLPEIGQAIFGQPSQALEPPDYLTGALSAMRDMWWVMRKEEDECPFSNSGARWKNGFFVAHAYDWSECWDCEGDCPHGQQFNLRWRDLEVSWYKHCTRGVSVNRIPTKAEVAEMLSQYARSIESFEHDDRT